MMLSTASAAGWQIPRGIRQKERRDQRKAEQQDQQRYEPSAHFHRITMLYYGSVSRAILVAVRRRWVEQTPSCSKISGSYLLAIDASIR
jgi:hypothetical protein